MSLNPTKLDVVRVRDPVTLLQNKRIYAVLQSGSNQTWKQYTTNSVSQGSINFKTDPPSPSIIVDRCAYLYLPMRLKFTGIPPVGQTLLNNGRDAPRQFPIMSMISTLQNTINSNQFSIDIGEYIHPMMHFNNNIKTKARDYSLTPSYPDQSQRYSDLIGSIRSPLGGYADSGDENVQGRGSFPMVIVQNPIQVVPGTTLTAIVDIAPTENLFISPWTWGEIQESGWYNVSTIDITMTFLTGFQALCRAWSHDDSGGTNVITGGSVTFGGLPGGPTSFPSTQPIMFYRYVTPLVTEFLNPNMSIIYPYFYSTKNITDLNTTVAAGASSFISSNTYTWGSIPRRVMVFVRQNYNQLISSPSNTDTYFRIDKVSLQYMGISGLLSSASPQQLYHITIRNHCDLSWSQFYGANVSPFGITNQIGAIGSIICLELTTSIGLNEMDAPGKNAQNQFQIDVNFTNISSVDMIPSLYVLPWFEGTFTINRVSEGITSTSVLTSQDVLNARSSPGINYKDVEMVQGGNFFSGLKNILGNVNNFLKDSKLISTALSAFPVTAPFSPIARNLGYGEGEGEGVLLGGAKLHRKKMMRERLM